jgi:hypothetical protein
MNDVFARPVGRTGRTLYESDSRPPATPVFAYAVASTVGGAAIGGSLTTAGRLASSLVPTAALWGATIVVLCLAIRAEFAGTVRPFPQRARQVPRRWLTWQRTWATAAAFGLMLGAGAFTLLHHATTYVLAALILVAPTVATGVALGAAYGGVRGLMLIVSWSSRHDVMSMTHGPRVLHGPRLRALLALAALVSTAAAMLAGST